LSRPTSHAVCGRQMLRRSFCRARVSPWDSRALKEEHVSIARERVFGPQGNMPGDRQFKKKLEGRKLMRWYFPSKYNLQDFRTEEYFEMQAERFAPREPHRSFPKLMQSLDKVAKHREELRRFFKTMDEATFLESPTLQDLYGLFRVVDGDPALPFKPPEKVFLEHDPMGGKNPVARVTSGGSSAERTDSMDEVSDSAAEAQDDAEAAELAALMLAVKNKKLDAAQRQALEARIVRASSPEEVRSVLAEEAKKLNVVMPLDKNTAVFEESSEGQRQQMKRYPAEQQLGGSQKGRRKEMDKAEAELEKLKTEGKPEIRRYLNRRHRFVDPMFRRRRLKWLERQMSGLNKEKEVKFNSYFASHPDNTAEWPTNKGSVTIVWPSPYH